MELEKIVKDQVYNVGRSNSESIREAIIKEFDALYDIQLNEEDIIIKNNQKVASITVYWIPEIRFIFDIVYEPMFKVNHARRKLG
ncbi:MAG: hypothetical protein KDD52_01585 [Bdellovibrionales bacterium]|nr:hypothetical protein [Bdellovibrionales bacterium]